jgi:hypothetical protein
MCVAGVNPSLDTHSLFDSSYREPKISAIDEFSIRVRALNVLAPRPDQFDASQGQLVLLGVIAAVESYLRTLFRRLIYFDPGCQDAVQKRDVTYGAAIHLEPELLPEALLERISFISKENIEKAIKELLGIPGGLPPDVVTATEDYVRICQLRHCAVHRFGKLGASNAISLGLSLHGALMEKPLRLDYSALQSAIAICSGFVKSLNNFLFNAILSRVPDGTWSGSYHDDRPKFIAYYALFADKQSATKSPPPKTVYSLFLKQRASFRANKPF